MTITWTPPMAAPANPVVSATAGGSLPVGTTYYVVICATTYERYYSLTPVRRSAPTAIQSATTDASNKTLTISWDAVAGASHYNVYITTLASGDTRWVQKRVKRISDGSQYYATTSGLSITISDTTRLNGYDHDTFAYNAGYRFPGNLDRSLGDGTVTISGAAGALDIDDLYAVIGTTYSYYDGTLFVIKANIEVASGATGTLQIENGQTVIPIHGSIFPNTSGFITTFEKACLVINLQSNRFYGKNLVLEKSVIRAEGYSLSGNSQNYLVGADNYLYVYSTLTDNGDNVIMGPRVEVQSNASIDDWEITNVVQFYRWAVNAEIINSVIGSYFYVHIDNYETADNITFRDNTLLYTNWQLRAYYTWLDPFPVYDCDFPNLVSGNNNHPIVYWSNANSYNNQLDVYRSIALKVLDEYNNAISGARVILKDKNNVEQFSTTTNASGDITKQDVLVCEVTKTSGGGILDCDYADQTPHTLTIQKPGYEKYTEKFTFNKKLDWQISLKRIKINVDQGVI